MKSLKKLLNALSVLLLGTSTSLNAQTPPQKPQPAPQTTQRPPVQKTEKDSKPIKYNTPILTPEQVIEGLLRLADSLHESTDITPERVKETLGISMKQTREGKQWRYAFSNAFPETEWFYRIRLRPGVSIDSAQLYFSFQPINLRNNSYPPMNAVCGIDLNAVHQALVTMGYEHISSVRPGLVGLGRQYKRGSHSIDLVYFGESKDNPYHKCLGSLTIR